MTDTLCVCGHAAEPHTHHRDRRDCSRCGRELCREFRPLTWWRRVLHRCGWYPAPLPDPVPAVDLASLFTPHRFAKGGTLPPPVDSGSVPALLSPGGWLAEAEPVFSPEQWERVEATVRENAVRMAADPEPALDADGHRIEVGDWVETLSSPCQIGEVVATLGQWCEVRIPTSSAPRAEYGARLRVIDEEES